MSLPMGEIARIFPSAARWPSLAGALSCLVAASLALAATRASAATYKWTDANGRVIYSDQPPSADVKYELVGAPPPPANPNAAKELAAQQGEVVQRRLKRAEEETKAAKTKADADAKREQCVKARGQLLLLQSDQNVYRSNASGQPVFMDADVRRAEQQQLQTWLKDNCSS